MAHEIPGLPTIYPYLKRDGESLRQAFLGAQTRRDIAQLLEVPDRLLRSVLYYHKERMHYREATLPKKQGGVRRLCVPPRNLRIFQDKLLKALTLVYEPKRCVMGFVRRRSICDNAIVHTQCRHLLSFDLADFFPSIHFGRVRGILQSPVYGLGAEAALTVAQIVTHHDGHLPQGAPTSPIMANMVCGPFDTAMMALAQKHRCVYSRYADDISISTRRAAFPKELAQVDESGGCSLQTALVDMVTEHGFQIREGKTRLRGHRRSQRVTGLIVNEFVNVSRERVRDLRALIDDCARGGLHAAAQKHAQVRKITPPADAEAWVMRVVRGRLAFLKMVRGSDDHVYQRLLAAAARLPEARVPQPLPLHQRNGQPLRRRSRRSPDWQLWASKYGNSVFRVRCVDERANREGFGTAFRVGPSSVVTAGHNVLIDPGTGTRRALTLTLPLADETPVTVSHARWQEHGMDLAMGSVTFPRAWDSVFVPTQGRIPCVGEEVVALGYPEIPRRHVALVMHVGRIEAVTRSYRDAMFLSVSFASGPGLSGSPLIDASGYCVGVMCENTFTTESRRETNREEEIEIDVGNPGAQAVVGSALAGAENPPMERAIGGIVPPSKPYGQAMLVGHWIEMPLMFPR